MKLCISGSMQLTEQMVALREELNTLGHEASMGDEDLVTPFLGKTDAEIETIKIYQKNNLDAIRDFWNAMQGKDALLVYNVDKNGIANYIGGNAFLEMGFAHVLGQQIFLWNPIPDMPYYGTEIVAMKPTVIQGDLALIQ